MYKHSEIERTVYGIDKQSDILDFSKIHLSFKNEKRLKEMAKGYTVYVSPEEGRAFTADNLVNCSRRKGENGDIFVMKINENGKAYHDYLVRKKRKRTVGVIISVLGIAVSFVTWLISYVLPAET